MQTSRATCGRFAALFCVLATIPTAWGQELSPSPAEWTDAEKEVFLQTAEILSLENIPVGTTGSQRATLSDGSHTHDAQIQTIDVFRRGVTQLQGALVVNFKDSYKFNIAGYRLARLLDLNVVPVSVQRRVGRRQGAVTWWVDDVQMLELDRIKNGIDPPDIDAWNDQMSTCRIFTELIYNSDPNLGNFLITADWKLHLIDFTRAFRVIDSLREPANVTPRIDRRLFEGLRRLDKEQLEEVMDGMIDGNEIDSLLDRRDAILEILDAEITANGESAVVYAVAGNWKVLTELPVCRTRSNLTVGTVFLATALLLTPPYLLRGQDTDRILAMADIHGNFEAAASLLQRNGLLDDRLDWIGAETTFVQTGDFTDRGPEVRRVMDLLMSMDRSAPDDRVVVLLGNHEILNMIGDLRDVTALDYASFADSGSESRRQEAFQVYVDFESRRAERLGKPALAPTALSEQSWMDAHPPGFFEHRDAFGPDGEYGRWLRERPTVVKLADTLFLHAGIHPSLSNLSIDEINRRVRDEIRAFDQSFEYLVKRGIALPFFTFEELIAVAQEELDALNRTTDPDERDAEEGQDVQILEGLLGMGGWLTIHPDGFLWYRGYSEWSDEEGATQLEQLLDSYDVSHIVVGHTPQLSGEIRVRFHGVLYLADTGMLSSYYTGGRASVLEIQNGIFRAIYLDDGARLIRPVGSLHAYWTGIDTDQPFPFLSYSGLAPATISAL